MNRLLNVNRLKMSSTRHSCDRHAVISQMWRHHPCRHLYDCRQLVRRALLVWHSDSALVLINNVDLHQARLVLGWVTVSGFSSRCRTFISLCNQPPRSTQPSHPFVGRCNEYQPKGGDALWLGSKGRYDSCVDGRLAGKTMIPMLHMGHI